MTPASDDRWRQESEGARGNATGASFRLGEDGGEKGKKGKEGKRRKRRMER
jgi:hypothetical protein